MTFRTRGQWLELLGPHFALGLSQREVARRVHLSRSRVSEVCRMYEIGPPARERGPERAKYSCPHCGGALNIEAVVS
jgi:hypothetical protein